jgi:hypothetical protein
VLALVAAATEPVVFGVVSIFGTDWLSGTYAIMPELLESWEQMTNTSTPITKTFRFVVVSVRVEGPLVLFEIDCVVGNMVGVALVCSGLLLVEYVLDRRVTEESSRL